MASHNGTMPIPDVIQAKSFQLVDDNGDVRAELTTSENGSPVFVLLNQNGQIRLGAFLDDAGNPGFGSTRPRWPRSVKRAHG
jgi:hypothetical protein